MVVVARYTERCLFTTTIENEVVVVGLSELCNFVTPIGVVVEVPEIHRTGIVIRDFNYVRGNAALRRIEVCLLQHHGVLVTVQHLHTLRLPRAGKAVREVDTCLTAASATGLNFDNTVSTARAPDCRCCCVFQDVYALDVFRVD